MFRRTCLVLSGLALAVIGCEDKRATGEQRQLDIDRSPVTEQPTARDQAPPPPQETGATDKPGESAVKPLMVRIESTQTAGDAIGTYQALSGKPLGATLSPDSDGTALRFTRRDLFDVLADETALIQSVFAGLAKAADRATAEPQPA